MMKKTKMVLGILICFSFLVACKKNKQDDTTPTNKPQQPITADLPTMADYSNTIRSSGPWELGVTFQAKTNGKITQLGSKMPQAGRYIVSLWDEDTKSQLRTVTIEQNESNQLKMINIDPVSLSSTKKLIVSVNSYDLSTSTYKPYYCLIKTVGGNFMPYTQGDIEILSTCYVQTTTPKFPEINKDIKHEVYGKPEITFIAN